MLVLSGCGNSLKTTTLPAPSTQVQMDRLPTEVKNNANISTSVKQTLTHAIPIPAAPHGR